jgi:sialidase-1
MIEYLETRVVYENPRPHVRSRHGYFPGIAMLPSGELLTLFVRGEAFEAADATTFITRSRDKGTTWQLQGPLYDKSRLPMGTSDQMKPTVLSDGTLLAVGYRFHRKDPEQAIAIPGTGGFQPGDNLVSFSQDEGKHWTEPATIEHRYPELIEVSGPAIETQSGDLLAVGALFHLPDGSNPSGPVGVLLRSQDKGRTWNDRAQYYKSGGLMPYEARICEMQPGRLVAILWAYDAVSRKHWPNQVVVSHDNGQIWSPPIDTGHMGQSSNLLWLGDDRLLSCHAHRGEDPGLYVRVVDFRDDRWRPLEEKAIWGSSIGQQTRDGQFVDRMFASMRFGQPSFVRLSQTEFLLVHWSIEDGQGKIRSHRLRIAV